MLGRSLWRLLCLALLIPAGLASGRTPVLSPQDNELTLLATIEVGGRADALVIDSCRTPGEVIFFNRTAGAVRFLSETTHTLSPDSIALPTLDNNRWIAFDRGLCLAYVVTSRQRWSLGTIPWREVRLHVVQDHELISTFSVNESRNDGLTDPPDSGYYLTGLALKQSNSEAGNPARLIIDDTRHGRIDVVDLNPTGTAAVNPIQRFAYDERNLETSASNLGNSLALETKHETLAIDDLSVTDHLYISDRNHPYNGGYGYIRVVRLNHPLANLNAAPLPEVNLNGLWPFANGLQGLDLAGPRDKLYIASGLQSFSNGYLGRLNTTNHSSAQAITLTYGDLGRVFVDWYDTRRVFIATFDGFYNDPTTGLYLHLVYDSNVVDTLTLKTGYNPSTTPVRSMAFDPRNRRLYLGIGTQILVVQVNYGLPPLVEPCDDCPKIYLPLLRN